MSSVDNRDLLSVLTSMFYRTLQLNLEHRLKLHKSKPANDSVDLSDKLLKHIDIILTTNRNDRSTEATRLNATADETNQLSISSSRGNPSTQDTNPHNALTAHLKTCRSNAYTNSAIGKKLQQSTYEHLQYALFNARHGKADIARVHADIAIEAMNLAHHFISDRDYEELSRNVSNTINN